MSLPPSIETKGKLRRALLNQRQEISEPQRYAWNSAIANHAESWLRAHSIQTLGVFWPIQGEPELLDLYRDLAQNGMQLALPVVAGKGRPLQFAAWQPGDPMQPDTFGVPTPAIKTIVPLPQALLIPCVGFNAQRFRLGYGGGFYDRTLDVTPRPLTLGIAYACQATEFVPNPHDIALDAIATEQRLISA